MYGSNLDFSVVDLGDDLFGGLFIDSAAEREACSEDLLDGALEVLGHGFFLDDLGYLLDLFEGEVSLVGDVLDLLSVALVVAELLDQQRR